MSPVRITTLLREEEDQARLFACKTSLAEHRYHSPQRSLGCILLWSGTSHSHSPRHTELGFRQFQSSDPCPPKNDARRQEVPSGKCNRIFHKSIPSLPWLRTRSSVPATPSPLS